MLRVLRRSYHKNVIDHFENPRNIGSIDKTKKSVGTGLVGAPACGDVMKLQIEVDESGKIINAKFKTFGCGSAIAASSFATELIIGKHINYCLKIKNSEIAHFLNLPLLDSYEFIRINSFEQLFRASNPYVALRENKEITLFH